MDRERLADLIIDIVGEWDIFEGDEAFEHQMHTEFKKRLPEEVDPFSPSGIITRMYNAGTDDEIDTVVNLLVKIGELWECPECYAKFSLKEPKCEFCSTPQPQK